MIRGSGFRVGQFLLGLFGVRRRFVELFTAFERVGAALLPISDLSGERCASFGYSFGKFLRQCLRLFLLHAIFDGDALLPV